MNVRGRILQVAFEATVELVSTEDFRVPYTLHGSVRAFNQELLDKDIIEEQLIFTLWRDRSSGVSSTPGLTGRVRSIRIT